MTTDAPALDATKMEAFGGKLMSYLNGGMAALMLSVGHRTGLFDAMATMAPGTSAEIAAAAGRNERYVREWLGGMVTAGIVDYDSGRDTYCLPAEHAAMLTRAAGPNNFATYMQMVVMCADVETQVVDCFTNGGGVPYSEYPRFHEVMAEVSGCIYDAGLVDVTLPIVPGIIDRLQAGIDVADVGAGRGHAVNVMAKAFPKSRFTAIDFSADALAVGEAEAAAAGLSNASFLAKDAASLDSSAQFDLVTTFDAVHDQANPLGMVEGIYKSLKPGGYWLCADIGASSHVGENVNHPMGTFFYGVSCMHCMTVSLAYDGVGLGAMWGVQKAREIFGQAGFEDITIKNLPGDIFNNYYICRK